MEKGLLNPEQFPKTALAFDTLRQFARRSKAAAEHCELCNADLCPEHPHLIELKGRKLLCACDACSLLFSGQADAKYKRVSRDVRFLENFSLSDSQWDSLLIPINLAFFFKNSRDGKMSALYPSPAGAMESLLPQEAWDDIVEQSAALRAMEPDVEALLVNRVRPGEAGSRAAYYIVPIDKCYQLVGLIRMNWRGLSGGTEVWLEIARFFDELKMRASSVAG